MPSIRPWTTKNVAYLKKRARKSKTKAIAARLHRSVGAVRQKALHLGLSLAIR